MAKALLIKATPRENKKPNALRASGFIPGTIYGHGQSSESIQIFAKEFSKIPHKAYSHINELELDGKKISVLIRNVQKHPTRDNFLNIEFYKIKEDEKLKVKVPLNYTGHSSAVTAGGVLIVSLNEIEVHCLPKDIPDTIDVSLDDIKEIGQAIHARDLKVKENITLLAKGDEVLVHVEVPRTHVVEEAAPVAAVGAVPGAEAAAPGAEATPTATPGKEAAPSAGKQAPASGAKAPETKPPKK